MSVLVDSLPHSRVPVDQDLNESARPASPHDEYDDVKNVEDENAVLRSQFSYAQSKALLRRADWHILPLLILLYLSKNMDGNLVSVCRTPMPRRSVLTAVRQDDERGREGQHPHGPGHHVQPVRVRLDLLLRHVHRVRDTQQHHRQVVFPARELLSGMPVVRAMSQVQRIKS